MASQQTELLAELQALKLRISSLEQQLQRQQQPEALSVGASSCSTGAVQQEPSQEGGATSAATETSRGELATISPAAAAAAAAAAAFSAPAPAPAPQLDAVPMAATRVVMHQIVMPAEVDALGICFGGQVRAKAAAA